MFNTENNNPYESSGAAPSTITPLWIANDRMTALYQDTIKKLEQFHPFLNKDTSKQNKPLKHLLSMAKNK